MMGRRKDGQGQFFYSFNLDEVVPPDHLVRLCIPNIRFSTFVAFFVRKTAPVRARVVQ
jgi:hypothetical protein